MCATFLCSLGSRWIFNRLIWCAIALWSNQNKLFVNNTQCMQWRNFILFIWKTDAVRGVENEKPNPQVSGRWRESKVGGRGHAKLSLSFLGRSPQLPRPDNRSRTIVFCYRPTLSHSTKRREGGNKFKFFFSSIRLRHIHANRNCWFIIKANHNTIPH